MSPPADGAPGPDRVPRLPALDGIRIVAATAVVVVHAGGASGHTFRQWGGWFEVMSVGVAIFFVLSGFVVFQPWVRAAASGTPAPDTTRFLVRRLARIVPACWVVVAACLIVLDSGGTAGSWLRHLTFTQIYTSDATGPSLYQTWTLCTEMSFYLVLPAFAAVAVGRPRHGVGWRPARTVAWTTGAAVLLTGVWLAGLATGVLRLDLHYTWLPAYAIWFGAGMIFCTAYVALREGVAPRAWRVLDWIGGHPWLCWAAALGLVAVGASGVGNREGLAPYTFPQFAVRQLLHLAIAVLVLMPLVFGPPTRLRAAVGSPPMRWLGGSLSYGLYLWHPLAITMVLRLAGWQPWQGHLLGIFVLTMLMALALALVSYYVVERPLIRLAGRFPGRRRSARMAGRAEAPTAVEV